MLVRVEMTADCNVRLSMFTGYGAEDVDLENNMPPSAARRLAILLLEEAERADLLWERLKTEPLDV